MKKRILIAVTIMVLGLAGWTPNAARAQEKPETTADVKVSTERKIKDVYRLEFVVRELKGDKTINSRVYTMSETVGDWGMIRVGSRVPFQVSDKNFQYQDVGINIDCKTELREDGLLLTTKFESSSALQENEELSQASTGTGRPVTGAGGNPIVRRVNFTGDALVTPGKPAIIAKLDDVATSRRYEIEVTATKVK